ncbi:MAG: hypothetical protein ACKJSK_05835 [Roseibacillus sp.]|mgnify:CR=1 FL=1
MLNAPLIQKHATLPEYFSKNGYLSLSRGKIFHRHRTVKGGGAPGVPGRDRAIGSRPPA